VVDFHLLTFGLLLNFGSGHDLLYKSSLFSR
jgi:hypothetical protein